MGFNFNTRHNVRSVQFGLLSIRIFFLSFFLLFFFFYWYFPWQTLKIHKIGETGEEIIIFLVFHFNLLTNIHLIHRDFYHLFLLDLFAIFRLIADETSDEFSLDICILFAFLCTQLSRSYWFWQLKVIVRIWAHIKLSPFHYKASALKNWDLHP